MNRRISEDEADRWLADQQESAGEDEQGESDAFHPGSVSETEVESPERFLARLSTTLAVRGIAVTILPPRAPRCFKDQAEYNNWLAGASLLDATVPYRLDAPAIPNYCHDCTPEFRARALAAGRCEFPHADFEVTQVIVQEGERKMVETEIIGVSRSKSLTVAEAQAVSLLPKELFE